MFDSEAIEMACRQERFGTERMQSNGFLSDEEKLEMKEWRTPEAIEENEKKARRDALVLFRENNKRIAQEYTMAEHAKFFFHDKPVPRASVVHSQSANENDSTSQSKGSEESSSGGPEANLTSVTASRSPNISS